MVNKTSKKSTKVAKPTLLAGDNSQIAKADGDGPPVLRFEAQLLQHPKTAKTDFQTLLNVPEWVSKQFPSRGMTKVEGTINERSSFPSGTGTQHVRKPLAACEQGHAQGRWWWRRWAGRWTRSPNGTPRASFGTAATAPRLNSYDERSRT